MARRNACARSDPAWLAIPGSLAEPAVTHPVQRTIHGSKAPFQRAAVCWSIDMSTSATKCLRDSLVPYREIANMQEGALIAPTVSDMMREVDTEAMRNQM